MWHHPKSLKLRSHTANQHLKTNAAQLKEPHPFSRPPTTSMNETVGLFDDAFPGPTRGCRHHSILPV